MRAVSLSECNHVYGGSDATELLEKTVFYSGATGFAVGGITGAVIGSSLDGIYGIVSTSAIVAVLGTQAGIIVGVCIAFPVVAIVSNWS